jgi:serine/threonine-protein kinase RsbW
VTDTPQEDPSSSLVVINDLSELARVGAWVNAWSRRHEIPSETAQRVDVCAAELITNIMCYAYADDSEHRIALRLDRDEDRLSLQIDDDGRPFDPSDMDEPTKAMSLEEAKIGGLGVHIVRSFSDELYHRRSDGRNHLTLIFRLPAI